ncbi:hypothetical protein CONPUDRAFT_141601 [Coniophora puteana RWD-64-598 SS2]|uniref:Uncharacterized protein n=1 Tax=Coniophora puteana (strain RWD-64-598) TaxID=741705 RepID=A0A5M3N0A8_CONPW|nr:uncharacterized protein CONPUDRAFT_141601 [Coniophora puteana RWD-64-598 SS2]EIW84687.1 hypothetical protein CONPUDRAFT_141601 [Coniophora puteana RWD-64-598 SS2]
MTYYRLRSICNPMYSVPSFSPNPPGDHCDDQVGVGFSGQHGIDAPNDGSYQSYLVDISQNNNTCAPNMNQSLPVNVQDATCNRGMKLMDILYEEYWTAGTWYYVWTEETATTENNTAGSDRNAMFNSQGCSTATSSPSIPISTESSAESSTPSSSSTKSGASNATPGTTTGTVVGGVVGGVAGLAILAGIWAVIWKKRVRGAAFRDAYLATMNGADGRPPMAMRQANGYPAAELENEGSAFNGSGNSIGPHAATSPSLPMGQSQALLQRGQTPRPPPSYNTEWIRRAADSHVQDFPESVRESSTVM